MRRWVVVRDVTLPVATDDEQVDAVALALSERIVEGCLATDAVHPRAGIEALYDGRQFHVALKPDAEKAFEKRSATTFVGSSPS